MDVRALHIMSQRFFSRKWTFRAFWAILQFWKCPCVLHPSRHEMCFFFRKWTLRLLTTLHDVFFVVKKVDIWGLSVTSFVQLLALLQYTRKCSWYQNGPQKSFLILKAKSLMLVWTWRGYNQLKNLQQRWKSVAVSVFVLSHIVHSDKDHPKKDLLLQWKVSVNGSKYPKHNIFTFENKSTGCSRSKKVYSFGQ